MAKLSIKPGSADVSLQVFVPDSASTTGGGKTGIAYNAASFVCYYCRPGSAAAQLSLATQTVDGAHSDGGWVEIDSTNMPGFYRFDLSDAVVAAGVRSVSIMLKGASGMAPVPIEIDLTNDCNVALVSNDATAADNLELACDNYSVTRGLAGTALPAVAADGAGGLPISDAGGLDLDTYIKRLEAAFTSTIAGYLDAAISTRGTADPGDAMTLTAAYDAAKTAGTSTFDPAASAVTLAATQPAITWAQQKISASVSGEGALHIVNAHGSGHGIYADGGDVGAYHSGGSVGEYNTADGAGSKGQENESSGANGAGQYNYASGTSGVGQSDYGVGTGLVAACGGGNEVTPMWAKAGDAMTLADDAITAAKFDESTAYPLKSADTGATAVARTGADSDTLQTLSDELDAAKGATFNTLTDSLEAVRDRGDTAWTTATGFAVPGDAMTLTEAYDAAKTAAAAGAAMTLTAAYDAAKSAATVGAAMTLTAAYDSAKTAAAAGAKMDLVDAPNSTAVTAIQSGLSTFDPATDTVATVTTVTNMVAAAPTAAENADALLGRNVAGGSSAGRLVKDVFRLLRNKVDTASTPGTMIVCKEDDNIADPAWTATTTTDAAAELITKLDPTT